jgi:hypothetical protein
LRFAAGSRTQMVKERVRRLGSKPEQIQIMYVISHMDMNYLELRESKSTEASLLKADAMSGRIGLRNSRNCSTYSTLETSERRS